jgi:hypothetical protein
MTWYDHLLDTDALPITCPMRRDDLTGCGFEQVARLGAQLVLQAAIEGEVAAFWAANATNAPRAARTPDLGCATVTAQPR